MKGFSFVRWDNDEPEWWQCSCIYNYGPGCRCNPNKYPRG